MAGFEGHSESQQHNQLFSAGSEVEVRSDEEGFKGAWFRATIVQSPASSASKKRKRALVEYKTLVTEDGSQPLKEQVDSAYIRPLPPQVGDQNLEEGHIVDADYRDGWWTGVVHKVIKHNSKFSIFFENPPDVLEFDRDRLRLHQDWVAGIWVRPNKQEILGASDSQPEEERAMQVLPLQNDPNHPEVAAQPKNSGAAGDNPESTNLRKNLVEQSSYTQSIKDVTPNAFQVGSLLGEKKLKTKQEKDGELDNQWMHSVKRKGRRTKSQVGSAQEAYICALPSQEKQKEKVAGKEGYAGVGSAGNVVQMEGISREAEVPLTIGSKAKGKEDSPAEYPCQIPNDDLLKLMRDQKKITNDQAQEKGMVMSAELGSDSILDNLLRSLVLFPDMEIKQQPTEGTSHKERGGDLEICCNALLCERFILSVSRKKGIVLVACAVGNLLDAGWRELEDLEGLGGEIRDLMKLLCMGPVGEMLQIHKMRLGEIQDVPGTKGIPNDAARTRVKASDNTVDDDQPLSTWFGGMQCPANVDDLNKSVEQVKLARESTPVDSVSDTVPDEDQIMPFVKSSPIWKAIESFDVFRIMPQNPHFRPLVKCKEEYHRFSIAFWSLFLTWKSMDLMLLSYVGRVNELLSIKQRQAQFEGESKDAENKIVENTHEKSKLEDEADCIEKTLIELKEKHSLIKAEIGAKERDIASLQLSVDAINERIKNARSDFEMAALVPLT
ncbi:hypothetical protein M0R45_000597 [Rubus argutus]|uniref:Agenet domain-containing protein n=1 Tax=Rubus argutus TaxID=59490 RepID=A0AAW1VKF3_RUBAR